MGVVADIAGSTIKKDVIAIRSVDDIGEGDSRKDNPRFVGDHFEHNRRIVDEVEAIAADVGATPAQGALAWLLAQGDHIAPIPGTTTQHRLEENVGAASIALTHDDLREIATALSGVEVQGDRYPAHLQARVGR